MAFPNKTQLTGYRFISSRQLLPGDWANGITDAMYSSQQVVPAGASQAAATPVNGSQVELITAAAAGVRLPASFPGAEITILNNSGNAQSVYPAGTEQIQTSANAYAAASTAVSLASGGAAVYRCVKAGFWQRITTA